MEEILIVFLICLPIIGIISFLSDRAAEAVCKYMREENMREETTNDKEDE